MSCTTDLTSGEQVGPSEAPTGPTWKLAERTGPSEAPTGPTRQLAERTGPSEAPTGPTRQLAERTGRRIFRVRPVQASGRP